MLNAIKKVPAYYVRREHHNVVNAVVDAHSRSFAVVRSERVVNDLAIDKVADDQERQTE